MTELESQVKEVKAIADKLWSVVKKDWFTINELVNKSNLGHEQAKETLTLLARNGLLKTKTEEDKYKHKIIFNNKERKEIIQAQIDNVRREKDFLQSQITHLEKLKKIKISFLVKA